MRMSHEWASGAQIEDLVHQRIIERKKLLEQHELLAQRNSAAVRLIVESKNGNRLLLIRKRGLGGERATFTDLAGALMIDRNLLRNILQQLGSGLVPYPMIGEETGWSSNSQGVVELLLKSDETEEILQEWVNGYLIQNIVIDAASGNEECDARVFGFQDYDSQAQYEVMIEMESNCKTTLTAEIHQELGRELDLLRRKAGKMLSNTAQDNWPTSQQQEIEYLKSILMSSMEKISPVISFIPTCRVSGKTTEKTHTIDIACKIVIDDELIELLRNKQYVTDLSIQAITGKCSSLPVLSPMILINQGELNSCAQSQTFEDEEIVTALRFGDTQDFAVVALGSQIFL